MINRRFCSLFVVLVLGNFGALNAQDAVPSIRMDLEQRLESAGEHRAELEKSIKSASEAEKKPLQFLIAYLPERDLGKVSGEQLLGDVRLAMKVRNQTDWQKQIPEEVFFNDVLPYANLDESRDPWRAEFYKRFWPLVKDAKSASEAAQILNANVFGSIKVKYSTGRRRANQSPKESIDQGLASCSGLSIILVDACRAVGVPARVAGIPKWANKEGNHTWVEIWDGDWHFTGAAEYDPAGLDRAWFNADAAQADVNSEMSSIYAVSYKPTGQHFPMAWARGDKSLNAINVTHRYTKGQTKAEESIVRLLVRVWNPEKTKRMKTKLYVWNPETPDQKFEDVSRDESFDTNDIASFELKRNESYTLAVESDENRWEFPFHSADDVQQAVELSLPPAPLKVVDASPLTAEEQDAITIFAKKYFESDAQKQSLIECDNVLDELLLRCPQQVRQAVWNAFVKSPQAEAYGETFTKDRVTFGEYLSPYVIKTVGERPDGGWPLVIAMHGGGGAPQELNDSQWKHMQIYYRDHPEVSGYKYLALRAPNNTWNGFYDGYVYPLIENLIAQLLIYGDVNANKVFIMGYSHGGYGAFSIGPKIPYRFAAVHASAAAPSDGESTPRTLRNTRFTFMVGEKDTAYGRRERCEAFDKKLTEIRGGRIDIYPAEFLFKPGFGHGGLPDRDMLKLMLGYTRNPVPREVSWELTDSVVKDFFWLTVDSPNKGQSIEARILPGNRVTLETKNVDSFAVWLDERLISMGQEINIDVDGKTQTTPASPSLVSLCKSLAVRRDINLAHSIEIKMQPKK